MGKEQGCRRQNVLLRENLATHRVLRRCLHPDQLTLHPKGVLPSHGQSQHPMVLVQSSRCQRRVPLRAPKTPHKRRDGRPVGKKEVHGQVLVLPHSLGQLCRRRWKPQASHQPESRVTDNTG